MSFPPISGIFVKKVHTIFAANKLTLLALRHPRRSYLCTSKILWLDYPHVTVHLAKAITRVHRASYRIDKRRIIVSEREKNDEVILPFYEYQINSLSFIDFNFVVSFVFRGLNFSPILIARKYALDKITLANIQWRNYSSSSRYCFPIPNASYQKVKRWSGEGVISESTWLTVHRLSAPSNVA